MPFTKHSSMTVYLRCCVASQPLKYLSAMLSLSRKGVLSLAKELLERLLLINCFMRLSDSVVGGIRSTNERSGGNLVTSYYAIDFIRFLERSE